MTDKHYANEIFSFGRDHGYYGRILSQTVVVVTPTLHAASTPAKLTSASASRLSGSASTRPAWPSTPGAAPYRCPAPSSFSCRMATSTMRWECPLRYPTGPCTRPARLASTARRRLPRIWTVWCVPQPAWSRATIAPAAQPLPELDDGLPKILFVGRADPRKGLPLLLRAFAQVRQQGMGARLVVVGVARDAVAPLLDEIGAEATSHISFEGYGRARADGRLLRQLSGVLLARHRPGESGDRPARGDGGRKAPGRVRDPGLPRRHPLTITTAC